MCGPIGDFKRQTEYFGDFRVLFDYFFPGILPTSPISIPNGLIEHWESSYKPAVANAVATNTISATQLISTTHAAIDATSPTTATAATAINVLSYNVFATNDAIQKLGGNPYGNSTRIYTGSLDDARLNTRVQRFRASATALSNLAHYETTGD